MKADSKAAVTGCQPEPEGKLISRAQAGDEAAFAALFEKHKRSVYSLCLRLTRVPADAEDLTQDVFLLLFRKIAMFSGRSAFSTWLYRLATNAALARLRKKGGRNLSLEQEDPHGRPYQREIGAPDPQLRFYIDRISLERAISNLPPAYRAVFALYVVHGYEHSEIAKMMNCSVGNSKAQLHKARRKLRAWLHSGAPSRSGAVHGHTGPDFAAASTAL